jgi:hypothetical protein
MEKLKLVNFIVLILWHYSLKNFASKEGAIEKKFVKNSFFFKWKDEVSHM